MRGPAVLVVLLAGCTSRPNSLPDPDPDPGPVSGPFGRGGAGVHCDYDQNCSPGLVCSRSHACTPTDQIRTVRAEWTLRGLPASAQTCAAAPSLTISFWGPGGLGGSLAYSPVPCVEGVFTIDKLTTSFVEVELGKASGDTRVSANVDPMTGEAKLDLPY